MGRSQDRPGMASIEESERIDFAELVTLGAAAAVALLLARRSVVLVLVTAGVVGALVGLFGAGVPGG